jgi:hypothetical protein
MATGGAVFCLLPGTAASRGVLFCGRERTTHCPPLCTPVPFGIAAGLVFIVAANAFGILVPDLIRQAIDALERPDVTRGVIVRFALLIVGAALLAGAAGSACASSSTPSAGASRPT